MPADLLVLLIGDANDAEFRSAAAAMARAVRVRAVPDAAAAMHSLAGGLRPEVIVIAQQRPGDIAPEMLEELRRLAPLAAVIALQSSWCEGEGRSGRPLPGVVRMSWRHFESEILPGLTQMREGRLPAWAGPATLTPEERQLRQSAEPLPQSRGTVGILAYSHETRRLLADICRSGGWTVAELRGTGLRLVTYSAVDGASGIANAHGQDGHATPCTCDLVVWDADELPEDAGFVIRRLQDVARGAGVVVLLGFPRAQDIERASAAGAVAVVSKPFAAGELLDEICRVVSRGSGGAGQE